MRIFLTGGTGYIGSAVLAALVRDGHEVTALVRSRDTGEQVGARGARPVIGNLAEPESYRAAAAGHDGYVHAAFDSVDARVDFDRSAIETLTSVASDGRASVLIYTSGVWVLGHTPGPSAEDAPLDPAALVDWRPAHESLVLAAAQRGVRPIVVRPGIVYGGSRGIIADLFTEADGGTVRMVGDGENHWPLVYDQDLGSLYATLAVHADAAGVYHANDEGDERVIDVVRAIATTSDPPPSVAHMPLDVARQELGAFADALALDQIVRSPRARALGWAPSRRSVAANVVALREEWTRGRRT